MTKAETLAEFSQAIVREYVILRDEEPDGLADMVDEALAKGWQCQGGIAVVIDTRFMDKSILYAQAMVRSRMKGKEDETGK